MKRGLSLIAVVLSILVFAGAEASRWQASTPAASWLQGPLVFAPEMPLSLADSSYATSLIWGSAIFESQGLRWPSPELVAALASGRSLSMWFSPVTPAQAMARQRPALQETACRDIDGKRIVMKWYPDVDPPFYFCCTNNPVWQDYLMERNCAAIDIGAGGIILDEIYGTVNAIWNGGGCFCPYCMAGFREFLAQRHSKQSLLADYGVSRIEDFDYGAYIGQRGFTQAWRDGRYNEVPLFEDFQAYQHQAVFEAMKRVIGASRDYGLERCGRYVPFAANINDLNSSGLKFSDLLDWLVCETFYKERGYPPTAKVLPVAQLAKGLGKTPCFLTGVTTNADLMNWTSSTGLHRLLIADAYAGGGAFMVPYDIRAYDEDTGASPGNFSCDLPAISHYYRFVLDNSFLFTGDMSPADVALLYSFAPLTEYVWNPAHAPFFDMAAALYDCGVTYDVLTIGDGKYVQSTISVEDLAPYPLVIIPDEATLDPGGRSALQAFCDEGGLVLCFSAAASRSLGMRGGRVIYSPSLISGYFEEPSVSQLAKLGNFLSARSLPEQVVVNGARGTSTQLRTWVVKGDRQTAIHLVNYDYDETTDTVRPTGPITISIPETLLGAASDRVYLLSPDLSGPELLNPMRLGSQLSVDVASVETWDVVFIVEQSREAELLTSLQDSLPQVAPGFELPAGADVTPVPAVGEHPLQARQALLDQAWRELEAAPRTQVLPQTPRVQAMPSLAPSEGAFIIDDFETTRPKTGGQYGNDHDPTDSAFYCTTSLEADDLGNHYRVFSFQWSKWLKFRLDQIPSFDASDYAGIEVTIWADSVMKVSWEVAFHDAQQPWTGVWLPDMALDTTPRRYRLPFVGFDPVPSTTLLESLFAIAAWPAATSGRVYWDDLCLYSSIGGESTTVREDEESFSTDVPPLTAFATGSSAIPANLGMTSWAEGRFITEPEVAVDEGGNSYLSLATNGQPFTGVVLQLGGKDLSQATGLYLRLASDGPTKFHIDLAHRDPAWPAGNQIAATPEIALEGLSPTLFYIPFSKITIGQEDLAECGDCETTFHFEDVGFLHLIIHSGASDFRLYEVGTYSER